MNPFVMPPQSAAVEAVGRAPGHVLEATKASLPVGPMTLAPGLCDATQSEVTGLPRAG